MTNLRSHPIFTDLPEKPTISNIQSYIESLETSAALYEDKYFEKRGEVIDHIEFLLIDLEEQIHKKTDQTHTLVLLKQSTEAVKSKLEGVDICLFENLRNTIREKPCSGKDFRDLIKPYVDVDFTLNNRQVLDTPGYDHLDVFMNGLLPIRMMPEPSQELEPEMVYYQKTPVRMIIELVKQVQVVEEDVFVDIGSGLGQATILVHLLSGIKTKGLEFELTFCDLANQCARELHLSQVQFIHTDARQADYSEGTLFFMFTPFKGTILQEVLKLLRQESLRRKIKIITYGPCTAEVALQDWLSKSDPKTPSLYQLGLFTSVSQKGS